jgi:hypothetical protein
VNAPRLPHPRAAISRATEIKRLRRGNELSSDVLHFAVVEGNPQSAQWHHPPMTMDAAAPWLCWSGSLGAGPFEPDPRNWMRQGHEAFNAWVERLAAAFAADDSTTRRTHCAVIPHHAQLLSDLSGQMRLWHQYGGAGIGTVLHPAALIAPSMLRDLEDHVTRSISMLASRCVVCILQDIEPVQRGTEVAEVRLVPWGSGQMPHALVERLLNEHLPPHIPICIPTDPLPT